MSRRGAAVVAVLLLAGCGGTTSSAQPTAQPAPTSSTAAPAASPSPTSERIRVSPTEVAGVRIGTPAEDAEQQLTQVLGEPVVEPLPGCYGESGRSLAWGALTAFLSDGGEGGPVVLSGWLVAAGNGSERLALPYETAIGQRTDEVMGRVPAADGAVMTEGPYAEAFLVTTPDAPGLLWRADAAGAAVDEAAFDAEVCD